SSRRTLVSRHPAFSRCSTRTDLRPRAPLLLPLTPDELRPPGPATILPLADGFGRRRALTRTRDRRQCRGLFVARVDRAPTDGRRARRRPHGGGALDARRKTRRPHGVAPG